MNLHRVFPPVQLSSDWCDHLEIKLVFVKCPVVNYSLFVALPWHMSSSVHILLQIGPNGYYFAIDPNGYVLLHPNLQPKVWGLVLWITLCGSCLEALYYFCAAWLHDNCRVTDGAGSFQTFPYAITSSIFTKRIDSPIEVLYDLITATLRCQQKGHSLPYEMRRDM